MNGVRATIGSDNKNKYPCFKICEGALVVLFIKPRTGTVVYSKLSRWYVGEYHESWQDGDFEPFHGTINIEVD